MAQQRMLSKRTRFEVFKRDEFTCRYCGKKPPEVILEVDHINPVSRGGDDNIINLLTACFDCNRGKSNIPIDTIKKRPDLNIINQENNLKEEQIKEYYKYLSRKNKAILNDLNEINTYWSSLCNNKYELSEQSKVSIKLFLTIYHKTKYDIMEAIDISTKYVWCFVEKNER